MNQEIAKVSEPRWPAVTENPPVSEPPPFLHNSPTMSTSLDSHTQKRTTLEWVMQICQFVVRDLEKYGICVIDNFMGPERAESIHRSVSSMYHSGVFVEGETVSSSLETTRNIRSDKIAWVDGTEKNCVDIAFLISTVDAIIMNSVRIMRGNGKLGQIAIGGRTKVR